MAVLNLAPLLLSSCTDLQQAFAAVVACIRRLANAVASANVLEHAIVLTLHNRKQRYSVNTYFYRALTTVNIYQKEIREYLNFVAALWRHSVVDANIERALKRLTA